MGQSSHSWYYYTVEWWEGFDFTLIIFSPKDEQMSAPGYFKTLSLAMDVAERNMTLLHQRLIGSVTFGVGDDL